MLLTLDLKLLVRRRALSRRNFYPADRRASFDRGGRGLERSRLLRLHLVVGLDPGQVAQIDPLGWRAMRLVQVLGCLLSHLGARRVYPFALQQKVLGYAALGVAEGRI